MALGVSNLMGDFGFARPTVHLHIGANATKGAVTRMGAGRMKHIDVRDMWLQRPVRDGKVVCHKIPREINSLTCSRMRGQNLKVSAT